MSEHGRCSSVKLGGGGGGQTAAIEGCCKALMIVDTILFIALGSLRWLGRVGTWVVGTSVVACDRSPVPTCAVGAVAVGVRSMHMIDSCSGVVGWRVGVW